MSDYSNICELRGRAAEGKGCSLYFSLRYCAKKCPNLAALDCTSEGGDADALNFTGPTPTPTPTPTPGFPAFTGLAEDGDSISVAGFDTWFANIPANKRNTKAVGGSSIANCKARVATVMANNFSDVMLACGANDLMSYASAQAFCDDVYAYFDLCRAINPQVVRWAMGIGPIDETAPANPGKTGFNARRLQVNAILRAEVGGRVDVYVPAFDQPALNNAAGSDVAKYADGLHPTASTHALIANVTSVVASARMADISKLAPDQYVFTATNNAALNTRYNMYALITGIKLGASAAGSVTGTGDFARGYGVFGTTPISFITGDYVGAGMTSAASNSSARSTTTTIGGVSATYTVTTAANVTPVSYQTAAGQQQDVAFASSSYTFANTITLPACTFFYAVYSTGASRQATASKLASGGTDYASTLIATLGSVTYWRCTVPVGTYSLSMTAPNLLAHVAFLGIAATNGSAISAINSLPSSAYNNPVEFPAVQTVNVNELGFVLLLSPAAVTRNDGSTQRSSLSVADQYDGPVVLTTATLSASAKPSVNATTAANSPFSGVAFTVSP